MKFKDYLKKLQELAEKHPELSECPVVTSSDDEGNAFNPVVYDPAPGHYDEQDREFRNSDEDVNAVCVN